VGTEYDITNWSKRSYAVPIRLSEQNNTGGGYKYSWLKTPSKTYLLGEPDYEHEQFKRAYVGYSGSDGMAFLLEGNLIRPMHAGASNFLFCDGHAASNRNWKLDSFSDVNNFTED
jgi:prepilin-type processing-associated H-X9-DG protein